MGNHATINLTDTVSITDFLDNALQLDYHYAENELKAEAMGVLLNENFNPEM